MRVATPFQSLALLALLPLGTPLATAQPALPSAPAASAAHAGASMVVSATVVISQFQTAGGTAADEFIELHNNSNQNFDLNGHRVVYRSSVGPSDVAVINWTTSTIIPPGGYYLIAHATGYDGVAAPDVTFPGGGTGTFAAGGGGFAIRQGAANTGTIIDAVAYGSATNAFREGTVTAAPAANTSRARKDSGLKDTDDNSADFEGLNPSAPRNLSSTAVLPVELVSFTAASDGGASARLTWTTASETDNAGFSIETLRSGTWAEVAFVSGRGTTSESHTYTRTVSGLAPGRHAFRLRQLDVDGTATLSSTVEVVITSGGRLSIFPSPARSSVRIEGLTTAADVVDALGRVVARAMPGEALSVSAWAPGVYVVIAKEPQRFVVAR